jgi:hypothetical protein
VVLAENRGPNGAEAGLLKIRKPIRKIPTRVTNTNMAFASADLLFSIPKLLRWLMGFCFSV